AAGKFPVLVVETMAQIIQEAENYAREGSERHTLQPLGHVHARRAFAMDEEHTADHELALEVPDMGSAAAFYAADQRGVTARLVARYRPQSPIMAFTPDERVARQIQLVWGVRPFVAELQVGSLDDIVQVVERELLGAQLVKPGDLIIILMGHPVRERPLTNLMRVHRIRGG